MTITTHLNTGTRIPDLEPYCGSWVIVCRNTGESVFETFNRSVAEKVNQVRYEVLTASQYLGRLNARIRSEG